MKHWTLEITQKSLFTLHHSELAWMELSQAGINGIIYHNLFQNSVIYPLGLGFSPLQPATHLWLCFLFGYT